VITTPDDSTNPHHSDGMTRAELLALPITVDIGTAARALGIGRSTGYELARRGQFPCRVLRVGGSYRIPTADLLHVLGIDPRGLASEPGEPDPLPPAA
jgi:excisionase family DNA binding protein